MHTISSQHSARIVTVKNLPTIPGYGWLTEQALRHLIFKAMPRKNSKGEKIETNGLCECGAIIRLGRKVLIDLDCFDKWLDLHRQTSNMTL